MSLGPLVLTPRLVEKPWGGRRFVDLGRDLPEGVNIGESWDVADLDASVTTVTDPVSRIAHGSQQGLTLAELIATHREELLGSVAPTSTGRFPLLVKHLDARQNLSVQVHPSEAVLPGQPGAHLKTESWLVVHSEPGAELMLGVVDGVSADDVDAVFGTPDLIPMIRRIPARVGDVHHVPAGLLHALGAGVVVAEPQTPSDTTYRLYDWTQEYDRAPRNLQRQQAMQCLRAEWEINLNPPAPANGDGLLVDTAHYRLSRTSLHAPGSTPVSPRKSPRVLLVVTGALHHHDLPAPLGPAGVALFPAAWSGSFDAREPTSWLEIDLV